MTLPLTNLSTKLFGIFFEIILWIILLGGIIGGGIAGYEMLYSGGGAILGIIVGGIISFLFIILFGGMISLFIKIANNIEALKNK